MSYGIQVAEESGSVDEREIKFSSTNKRMILDLESDPRHFDLKQMAGGTALSVPANGYLEETLLTVPHKLGYTPLCVAYFYVYSRNNDPNHIEAGNYQRNWIGYQSGNVFQTDYMTFKVDKDNFRLIHRAKDDGGGSAFTSTANSYQIRIKYYIMAIPTGMTSYWGEDFMGGANG